ncbi:MAG: hypothetical protein AAF657_34525 [Acidobacteriota bacterium]
MTKRPGLGARATTGDPIDDVLGVPADQGEPAAATPPPRHPATPKAQSKGERVKLSVRIFAADHATMRRLGVFAGQSMSDIVAAGVAAEVKRRLKAYKRQTGNELPELPELPT